jgi:hypothetical protein
VDGVGGRGKFPACAGFLADGAENRSLHLFGRVVIGQSLIIYSDAIFHLF